MLLHLQLMDILSGWENVFILILSDSSYISCSHSNVDFSRKKIKCELCAFDKSESEKLVFTPAESDDLILKTNRFLLQHDWRRSRIDEIGLLSQSSTDIVDFVISEILENCFSDIHEKRSYSQRLVVYERSLFKECSECQVVSPQHFPLTNTDCVYQVIPSRLFSETFERSSENSKTEENFFRMKENVNEDANSVENATKTRLVDPCDLVFKEENGQQLNNSPSCKGQYITIYSECFLRVSPANMIFIFVPFHSALVQQQYISVFALQVKTITIMWRCMIFA